jgi:hypothetical protein
MSLAATTTFMVAPRRVPLFQLAANTTAIIPNTRDSASIKIGLPFRITVHPKDRSTYASRTRVVATLAAPLATNAAMVVVPAHPLNPYDYGAPDPKISACVEVLIGDAVVQVYGAAPSVDGRSRSSSLQKSRYIVSVQHV